MSIEKDRSQFPFYSEQEMNDNEATRNYCKNTVFIDETGNDEAMVYNMRAMAFMAGIKHARQGERERFRDLRDMYLDHMEGTTVNEFEFWESLYLAAHLIVETMEREEKTGSPYPWGDK